MIRNHRLDRLEAAFAPEARPCPRPEENHSFFWNLIGWAEMNYGAETEALEVLGMIDAGDPDADEASLRLAHRLADVSHYPYDDRVTAAEARWLLRWWEGRALGVLPDRVRTADGRIEFERAPVSPEEVAAALRDFDPDDEGSARLARFARRLQEHFDYAYGWEGRQAVRRLPPEQPDPRVEALVARLAALMAEWERSKR